jgi:two-component system chemotaxis response regulator CheB
LCPLPVAVASPGRRLAPGSVSIAPSGVNLIVHDSLRVTTAQPPTTQYHVPGIDETLSSIASAIGQHSVGVLLTGMGRDGAVGLKRMRERGALTIAQDESTSAVYGMPAAAVAIGAAELQLPIDEVGSALRQVAMPAREASP